MATFVHVKSDGLFCCTATDGSSVEIGSKPVAVDDPALVAYLDSVPHVKRAKEEAE